jgi:hypothetical protein
MPNVTDTVLAMPIPAPVPNHDPEISVVSDVEDDADNDEDDKELNDQQSILCGSHCQWCPYSRYGFVTHASHLMAVLFLSPANLVQHGLILLSSTTSY